jgi:hypothetical protein
MSKLCATELRTSPNGANFEFTGDDGDLTSMNIDHIRELARKLADRSGQRVNALDAEGSRAYEQLSTILQRYRDTGQPYQEIYEVIITEFANVTAINPGTVADKFLSCHRSTGCGANECNPACINSIMKRPGDVGKHCSVNVYSLEGGQLTLQGARVHNSSTAVIYIYGKGEFTKKLAEELKRSGINQISIYRVDNGACTPLFNGQTVPIDDVVKGGNKGGRRCLWNCGDNGNQSDSASSGSWGWKWIWLIVAIIIAIIVILIIVFAAIWLIRKSAMAANSNPETCTNFQQRCASIYNRVC